MAFRVSRAAPTAILLSLGFLPGIESAAQSPAPEPPATTTPPAKDSARTQNSPAVPPAQSARLSRLQGSATVERNRPVIGAAVIVIPEVLGGEIVVTTTDARGFFRMDGVPDGSYTVMFQRGGLDPVRKEHVELKAPFRPTVEVTMRPGATAPITMTPKGGQFTLSGRATDRDGGAVADLKVRLTHLAGDSDPIERITGTEGEFSIPDLAAGPWILDGRGLAYLSVRAVVPLEAGEVRVRLVLVPQPPAYDPIPIDLLPPEEPIPPPTPESERPPDPDSPTEG